MHPLMETLPVMQHVYEDQPLQLASPAYSCAKSSCSPPVTNGAPATATSISPFQPRLESGPSLLQLHGAAHTAEPCGVSQHLMQSKRYTQHQSYYLSNSDTCFLVFHTS